MIEVIVISGSSIEFHIKADGAKMPRMTIEDLAAQMTSEFKKVNGRLDVIEQDIKDMKNTPTMKKELALSK